MMIYLMEATFYDLQAFQERMLRVSSGDQGYCTLPSDDPSNAWYEPRLKIPADYQCRIFKDGLTGGAGEGGFGVVQLLNPDGFFDPYLDYAWDGRQVRILYGESRGPYSGFSVVMTGTMCQPECTWSYMQIKLRDYTELFDKALSQFVYLGNNVEGAGFEGSPDDLMGKTKPLAFGKCLNVTPAWVSAENMILQVHNGPVKGIDAVYSNGTSLPFAQDYATKEELAAATVPDGGYSTCLASGMFKITGGAQTDITADVRGCNLGGVYVSKIPDIIKRIIESYIPRPRTNWIKFSEDLLQSAWAISAGIMESSDTLPPVAGMKVFRYSGTGTVTQTLSMGTSMLAYSKFFKADGCRRVRLVINNHENAANSVLAEFDLTTGIIGTILATGTAVGPQYSNTGYITDAGLLVYPGGWFRLWVAGQPDSTFSAIDCTWSLPDGGAVFCTGAQLEKYSSPAIYTGPTQEDPVTGYDPTILPQVDEASFAALSASGSVPYDVGYFVAAGDTATASSVMSALCDSGGVWWSANRSGAIVVGQFHKPTGLETPVATYTATEILQGTMERQAPFDSKDGTQAFRVIMSAVRNWTKQEKSNIASALWLDDPVRVAWLNKEWREVWVEDLTTLHNHPLSCQLQFTSYIADQTAAILEARRRLAIYQQRLDRYVFSVKLAFALAVNIGDIVRIALPRWNLAMGANFMVVGITETHESGQVSLEVLG